MTGKLAWAIGGKPRFPSSQHRPKQSTFFSSASPGSYFVSRSLFYLLKGSPPHSRWSDSAHCLKVLLFLNGLLFHLFFSVVFLWGFLSSVSVVLQVEPVLSLETHPLFSPSFPTSDSFFKKINCWGKVDSPPHTFEVCNLVGFDKCVRLWNQHQNWDHEHISHPEKYPRAPLQSPHPVPWPPLVLFLSL